MKYKTLFRLAVKLVGVWLCIQALISALQLCFSAISMRITLQNVQSQAALEVETMRWMMFLIAILIKAGLGIYLIRGGEWIVNLAIPANRPYCPHCGYDLKGRADQRHCPECGVGLPAEL